MQQILLLVVTAALVASVPVARAGLTLGPMEFVGAGGMDIDVPGYSVPSFAQWNGDGLADLIVGEGSGSDTGKVRVYLNTGSAFQPQFTSYSYVRSDGAVLRLSGSG